MLNTHLEHSAAVAIQTTVRMSQAQQKLKHKKQDQAATKMQTLARTKIARQRMKQIILQLPPKLLIKYRLGRVARSVKRARRKMLAQAKARAWEKSLIDDKNYLQEACLEFRGLLT